jgi:hypothetical protein
LKSANAQEIIEKPRDIKANSCGSVSVVQLEHHEKRQASIAINDLPQVDSFTRAGFAVVTDFNTTARATLWMYENLINYNRFNGKFLSRCAP